MIEESCGSICILIDFLGQNTYYHIIGSIVLGLIIYVIFEINLIKNNDSFFNNASKKFWWFILENIWYLIISGLFGMFILSVGSVAIVLIYALILFIISWIEYLIKIGILRYILSSILAFLLIKYTIFKIYLGPKNKKVKKIGGTKNAKTKRKKRI